MISIVIENTLFQKEVRPSDSSRSGLLLLITYVQYHGKLMCTAVCRSISDWCFFYSVSCFCFMVRVFIYYPRPFSLSLRHSRASHPGVTYRGLLFPSPLRLAPSFLSRVGLSPCFPCAFTHVTQQAVDSLLVFERMGFLYLYVREVQIYVCSNTKVHSYRRVFFS